MLERRDTALTLSGLPMSPRMKTAALTTSGLSARGCWRSETVLKSLFLEKVTHMSQGGLLEKLSFMIKHWSHSLVLKIMLCLCGQE
jgi:hypothetical protein